MGKRSAKLNILIGGPAGAGIEKSGRILTLSFVRGGYFVFGNVEHMSQIRGGNNYLRIRVDEKAHECHVEEIDVMIALDAQTIIEHIEEMNEGGVVIFDGESVKLPENFDFKKAVKIDEPLKRLAAEELQNPVMANLIALGIVMGVTEYGLKGISAVVEKVFGGKGAEVVAANNKALEMGEKIAKEKYAAAFPYKISQKENPQNMFLMGNDALCLGAMKAGLKFVGEYPMTPSSSVLHFTARWAEKYGIVVKHTEDEIAAINSVIGAGFAGVRAMAATSGGGFALMGEAIGLASMNEVPVVLVNVMRPGPATGQPTRTGAADLRFVIHAAQDDPVKIVLLPATPEDCFYMTFQAFNLAEKYQMPVILCFDKYLGEGYYTVAPFDESDLKIERGKILRETDLKEGERYKRYLFTEDGVSPRTIPGVKGGTHRATSDEHNEYGEICETAENRRLMMEKRMKKVETALAELPKPEIVGTADAEITFVTWSSAKGACMEACELLAEQGVKANVLQIKTAYPFHKKETKELLDKCKRLVIVEANYTAQMAGLIAENTGVMIEEKILRYDGRPFTAKYILEKIIFNK